jgi:hypothetical protein
MRIACWTPKATNTLSEYVILITFQRQQWLYERAAMLRNQRIARLVPFTEEHLLFTVASRLAYAYLYHKSKITMLL